MCGRFVVASSPELLAAQFDVDENRVSLSEPDYNIAPRQLVMVVRERREHDEPETSEPRRYLDRLRWGLVPSWAKDPSMGDRMINARAEGIAEKPAFKRAFERHRCIVPADGFYEWQVVAPPTTPKGRPKKQPVFIHRRDGEPMALAGLWAAWKVPEQHGLDLEAVGDDGWLRTCTIVTGKPNDLVAPVHDRMPVMLPRSQWDTWLDPANDDTAALEALLVPIASEELEMWPVGPLVNKADNKGPEVAAPVSIGSAHD